MKHFSIGLAALSLALLLSACQAKTALPPDTISQKEDQVQVQDTQTQDEQEEITKVPPAPDVNYRYLNGIKFQYEDLRLSLPYLTFAESVRIEGLKDRQVQERINASIQAEVLALCNLELPPYRGIRAAAAGYSEADYHVVIYSYVYYNEANVFSMVIRKSIRTLDYVVYAEDVVPLTFNLVTGGKMSLADLFYDGYDYQAGIIEYVRSSVAENRLYENYNLTGTEEDYPFTMLKPFETVKESQKFLLVSNDQINLIFDYDTPEFDVSMEAIYLPVQSQYMAEGGAEFVFARQYETWDESLYVNENSRVKCLKENSNMESNSWESEVHRLSGGLYGVDFYTNTVIDTGNRELNERVARQVQMAEERMAEALNQEQILLEECLYGSYRYSANVCGGYLTETTEYNLGGEQTSRNRINSSVYDTETGKQLLLKDCFEPGVDYQAALIPLLMAEDSSKTQTDWKVYLEDAEFRILSDSLGIILKTEDYDRDLYASYDRNLYVSYHDLGYDKLTLFDGR